MLLDPDFHRRYGPWAVVAGASEGIGQAYAHVLAEKGINLITLARRIEPLEADAKIMRRRHRVGPELGGRHGPVAHLGRRHRAVEYLRRRHRPSK